MQWQTVPEGHDGLELKRNSVAPGYLHWPQSATIADPADSTLEHRAPYVGYAGYVPTVKARVGFLCVKTNALCSRKPAQCISQILRYI